MIDERNIQIDPSKGPYDLDAEMSFLGSFAICADPSLQARMRSAVSHDSFYLVAHEQIFSACGAVLDDGRALDVTTLRAEMRQRNTYDDIGGDGYIGKILDKVPSAIHGEHYAEIVQELHLRRLGAQVGYDLFSRLMRPALEETATAAIGAAINRAVAIQQKRTRVSAFSLAEIVAEFLAAKDDRRPASLLTGIRSLDEMAGVFSFGKYTVIAGRPSMGKSTFVRWILQLWAQAGTPVGLVAVEEDRQKIAGNYLSSISELENHVVAYSQFSKEQAITAAGAATELAKFKWWGIDTAFSISEVCNAVELLATEKQCKVIAVDHIHLIKPDRFSESEQREVKEVSRRLKEIGKRHNVILIAAAQLSRPSEKVKYPPPPTLTDLRASGAIEEHADAVLLLHREDYYHHERATHCCEVIVAKNRNGKRGKVGLYEELKNQRFREPSFHEEQLWSQPDNSP